MLKTGFVGCVPDIVYRSISGHPGFEPTGFFIPDMNKSAIPGWTKKYIPFLSLEDLLSNSDVLIIQRAGPGYAGIITKALKHSRHVLLLEATGLSLSLVRRITALHSEAQSVIKILHPSRTNPALKAAMPMVTHPSFFDIRLHAPRHQAQTSLLCESPGCHLLEMLDAMLYLCPVNIQKIRCFSHSPGISSTGPLNARIEFDNGSVANILYSGFTERKDFRIFIYQEYNLVEMDLEKRLINVNKSKDPDTIKSYSQEFEEDIAGKAAYRELDNFYQSIIHNTHSGKDLFEISRLIELCHSITGKFFLTEPA